MRPLPSRLSMAAMRPDLRRAKRRLSILIGGRNRARSSRVDLETTTNVHEVETNLEAVVRRTLAPLYERFDGYEISVDFVLAEINDLRRQPGFGRKGY